jgi:hypothetical protein
VRPTWQEYGFKINETVKALDTFCRGTTVGALARDQQALAQRNGGGCSSLSQGNGKAREKLVRARHKFSSSPDPVHTPSNGILSSRLHVGAFNTGGSTQSCSNMFGRVVRHPDYCLSFEYHQLFEQSCEKYIH